MVKTFPKPENREGIVRISDPAMQWHEVDLNALLACARRELSLRRFVYPKRIADGKLSEKKAAEELELQQGIVDFLVHCIFKAVTRRAPSQEGG